MELRIAVRKGSALTKQKKISEAIAEYERALKIEPGNKSVQKDLDILRKSYN